MYNQPHENCVIEQAHRTLKSQFLRFRKSIPEVVKRTTDLELIVERVRVDLNKKNQPIKNYKRPPDDMHRILLNTTLKVPQVTFTKNESTSLVHQYKKTEIEQFRYGSITLDYQKNLNYDDVERDLSMLLKAFLAKTANIEKAMERFHALDASRFDYLEDKNEESLELQRLSVKQNEQKRAKKEPKKRLKKNQRDQLNLSIFCELTKEQRPKHAKIKPWGQFQLICAILAFTGARLNKLRFIVHDDIIHLIKEKRLNLYQPKVNKYREVYIIDIGVSYISEIYYKYKDVIFEKDTFLFLPSPNKRYNGDQFIRLRYKFFKPFSEKHNYNLKTHSFRINFATTILQATHAQNAQQIRGHKDIRSTMTYNRYLLSGQEKK